MIQQYTELIRQGQDLKENEAYQCLQDIFSENCPEEEIIELLKALIHKGESLEELIGFSRSLLENCVSVDLDDDAIDLCGTGGSGLERYNISTSVAFLLAASGIKVAKHGNKGSSKNNGSFDLLEKLGIDLQSTPEEESRHFARYGLCFLFARTHHPAMKNVGPARAKLGQRSIFNLIGPLCNPANVSHQIVGVSNPSIGPLMAEALLKLGKKKVMIVHGEPGIDELSISGKNTIWLGSDGKIEEQQLNPSDLGIEIKAYSDLPHGDCEKNAQLFHQLLEGDPCQGLDDMVALNAGAAMMLVGATTDISEGYQTAKANLKNGKAKEFFEAYPKID